MNNVRPLRAAQRSAAPGILIPTLQATDQGTGQLFAWHPVVKGVIQVFDSTSRFMQGERSDLVLPFPDRLINPVSGIPAYHHYVDTIRRFQNRQQ